jgi:CheY-like chemotaxis protein
MSGSISVLIVDDNPPVVITLADVLVLKGFTVHAVFS